LVAYNGSFTITTQAAPATQVVSGVGFQPKAVIFFWTRQDVTDTKQDHIRAGYGFTSGSGGQRAVALASDHGLDANTAADTGRMQSDTSVILMLNDGAPALGAEAQLVSLDGDGFTLNWISNEGRSDIIHFIALGGTDLTGAQAGTFTKQSGTGGQPVGGNWLPAGFPDADVDQLALTSATQGRSTSGLLPPLRKRSRSAFSWTKPASSAGPRMSTRDPIGSSWRSAIPASRRRVSI
jgi:hypothetical protein